MPRLVLEGSAPAELTDQVCEVGRLASCGLTLQEPQSSRKHFQIEPRGSRWWVVDLGSRNGTYLNEERLSTPVALRHGDQLRVGETVVRYEAAPPPLAQGTKLGSVVLDGVLGRSPWGTLYRGKQGALEREVCVEVVDPDLAGDKELRDRYQRRARAAGAFEHPVVRAVFDTSASGAHLFTVFEAFAGMTLEERLVGAGPLERGQALSVLTQVADALAHVHARGKLHGLLSTRAVLVDAQARAKLVDLGEEPGGRLHPHQADGALLAGYASPEEARGQLPDATSDVFALGVLASRLLLGRLPWAAGKKREELLDEIGQGRVELEGADPATRQALERLLALDRAARPTAAEALGLLQELPQGGGAATPAAGKRGPTKEPREKERPERERPGRSLSSSSSSDEVRERPRDSAAGRREAGKRLPSSSDDEREPAPARGSAAGPRGSAAGPRPARPGPSERVAPGEREPGERASERVVVRQPSGPPPLPRLRISDRLQQPEPGWFLPLRLLLLGLGYGLVFAAAALLVRLLARF